MACCVQKLLISQLPLLLKGPRRFPQEKRSQMQDLREGSSLLWAGMKSKEKLMFRCGCGSETCQHMQRKGSFLSVAPIILPRRPAGAGLASSPPPWHQGSPCPRPLCPTPGTHSPSQPGGHCCTDLPPSSGSCMYRCVRAHLHT